MREIFRSFETKCGKSYTLMLHIVVKPAYRATPTSSMCPRRGCYTATPFSRPARAKGNCRIISRLADDGPSAAPPSYGKPTLRIEPLSYSNLDLVQRTQGHPPNYSQSPQNAFSSLHTRIKGGCETDRATRTDGRARSCAAKLDGYPVKYSLV